MLKGWLLLPLLKDYSWWYSCCMQGKPGNWIRSLASGVRILHPAPIFIFFCPHFIVFGATLGNAQWLLLVLQSRITPSSVQECTRDGQFSDPSQPIRQTPYPLYPILALFSFFWIPVWFFKKNLQSLMLWKNNSTKKEVYERECVCSILQDTKYLLSHHFIFVLDAPSYAQYHSCPALRNFS